MRAHILRPSPKVICVVVGFFQHLVRPEIGMEKATGEADPRLGCVGRETRKQDADADRRGESSGAGEDGGEARMECTDGRVGFSVE